MTIPVPLSDEAVALLSDLNAINGDGEWVFPSPRPGKHIQNVQKAATRVRALTSVDDFVLYDLRRTAATLMTKMGTSRLVVGKILNHVEAGVTHVYDRYSYEPEKRLALSAWAARLNEIVEGG